MAVIPLLPSTARLLVKATVAHNLNYGPISDTKGGLFPLHMAAFLLDEYRMLSGWPVAVPPQDIHGDTLMVCDGLVISFREDPNLVDTNAVMRWISSQTETYDPVSLKWYAYNGSSDSQWETSTDFAPTFLNDYEYQVGSEKFYMDVLNFDHDSKEHMWSDLTPVIGGAASYSVLMVANLHSVFGDTDSPITGIWGPGYPTPATEPFTENISPYVSVTLRGESLYLQTNQTAATKTISIADLLSASAPFYLAFCFGRPYSYIYAGAGPSSMRRVQTFSGSQQEGFSGSVALGRTAGNVDKTVDMGLLGLGIYPGILTSAQVNVEVAKLSAVYGGDK